MPRPNQSFDDIPLATAYKLRSGAGCRDVRRQHDQPSEPDTALSAGRLDSVGQARLSAGLSQPPRRPQRQHASVSGTRRPHLLHRSPKSHSVCIPMFIAHCQCASCVGLLYNVDYRLPTTPSYLCLACCQKVT